MFEGKVVLVTGAGRGIGRAIAKAFADQSAHVIVNDILLEKKLTDIAGVISPTGIKSIGIQADVSNSDQVKDMMQQAVKTFGRLDILVNNAGIIRRGSIDAISEKDWESNKANFITGEILDVNGGFLID